MSGLWFVVCIPKEHEEKLSDEKKKIVKKNEANKGLNSPTEYGGYITDSIKRFTDLNNELAHLKQRDNTSQPPQYNLEGNSPESLEKVLENALQELDIHDAVWTADKGDKHYQVYFPCEYGVKSDKVLRTLTAKGFGHVPGTSLGVVPFTLFYHEGDDAARLIEALEHDEDKANIRETDTHVSLMNFDRQNFHLFQDESETETEYGHVWTLTAKHQHTNEDPRNISKFKALQQKFLKSVTARLTVAQVVEGIKSGSEFTFDYVFYILSASMIAAMGLMENSPVSLIAAMLVSPLMGPILATTFGIMIHDCGLTSLGLRNAGFGLLLCITFGFIFGLICFNFVPEWNSSIDWPTIEMVSRGQTRGLWAGVLVALPSGVGAGLAILSGNMASIIGVAISAALLPPAVNCGMFWGYSLLMKIWSRNETPEKFVYEDQVYMMPPTLQPRNNYTVMYSPNMSSELAIMGLVSVGLTLLNIACIYIMAMLVLKIKEVAPHTSLSNTQRFWKHDIKIARDYNKTLGRSEGGNLGQEFLQEWATISGLDPNKVLSDTPEARMAQLQTLQDIVAEVENDEVYQTVIKSAPGATPYLSQQINVTWHPQNANEYPSLYDLGMRDRVTTLGRNVEDRPDDTPKQRRESKVLNWLKSRKSQAETSSSQLNLELNNLEDGEFHTPEGRRRSTLLRQTLQTTGHNPFSLWPSRFQVTRVDGEEPMGNPQIVTSRRPSRSVLPPPRRASIAPSLDVIVSRF